MHDVYCVYTKTERARLPSVVEAENEASFVRVDPLEVCVGAGFPCANPMEWEGGMSLVGAMKAKELAAKAFVTLVKRRCHPFFGFRAFAVRMRASEAFS